MVKRKAIPPRSKVKNSDTWDLCALYPSDAAWDKAYSKLEKRIAGFAKFQGKLGSSPKVLRDCCVFEAEFDREAERLSHYAFLKSSEDVADSVYQGMLARYMYLATNASEAASFIAPELRAIPKAKFAAFLASPLLKDFRLALERLDRYRPHILSRKEERLLAMQGEVAQGPSNVFEQLNDADLKFGEVKNDKGEMVELSQSSLRPLLESSSRAVRRKAFDQFYTVYDEHKNTFAASLNTSVLQDVYGARVRNYPSALEGALFGDNVPVAVYDNLISAVHNNLDAVYHYLAVRKRALKLRELHPYDLYAPLGNAKPPRVSYEKAARTVVDALAPLGSGYQKVMEKGLTSARWVDRYENKGKRSGAFSAGGYDGPPYILMNYQEDGLDSMFTLAHEAGHSMHTHYSAKNQPFQYYHYAIFVAEVASTFNEQLLNHHLLTNVRDKNQRIQLICREIDEIRGTLIRQTMFAEYEKIIHAAAEAGEPLTVDRFREAYQALLERYFGPGLEIGDALSLEGLRIPHFYRAFYVYKYATGISAAIALSRKVLQGGPKDRARYLNFLTTGRSKYPLDLLRDAGVDLESPEPVDQAMARFRELVAALDDLV